ncbi:hypothetical protein LNV08_20380 [Paucibacter sp. TC2R-5]|uniref:hypothetical protein n=1 Tax=Paucibacter sp. TC2R-5 TaxID=2893555 RepID=UPI0021E43A25|nr:hypothetical protein [Paucibacter sp. TC2R-5]MCV2361326.1 hypothetical protein [Paucibacter sp. TC2R-5]
MFAQTTRLWTSALASTFSPNSTPVHVPGAAGQAFLAMPFDAMRFHYASAVAAGLAHRSILAPGQFEQALDTLEKLILGPLARQR